MLFAQLIHAIGLNDVCDWLRMKLHLLARRGPGARSRNWLSHANKTRAAAFMEKLFWEQLAHFQRSSPFFASGNKGKGLLLCFKVRIHAADSTVIQLYANVMDWAKHRTPDGKRRRGRWRHWPGGWVPVRVICGGKSPHVAATERAWAAPVSRSRFWHPSGMVDFIPKGCQTVAGG